MNAAAADDGVSAGAAADGAVSAGDGAGGPHGDHGHRFGSDGEHDSAGLPWAGRRFESNPHAGDDGSADPALLAALEAFRVGVSTARPMGEGTVTGNAVPAAPGDPVAVVDAVRGARLLVPLLAEAGTVGRTASGRLVEKTQELSLVTVAGPDGIPVLPAFTSVDTMRAWDAAARPVPVEGQRLALAAASESSRVVLDPASPGEFAIRRTALVAIATGAAWLPAHADAEVQRAFAESFVAEPAVHAIDLLPGDPEARLSGPELLVVLALAPGLDRPTLDALLERLSARWSAELAIADRVDSLAVRLRAV